MSGALGALLWEGVATGIFPSACAVVSLDGERVFEGAAGGATTATRFDLASLTKVMGTTAAFMSLWRDGLVAPETLVAGIAPAAAAAHAGLTLGDLLWHRGGLPAFVPFFADALRDEPRLRDPGCPAAVRAAVRQAVVARVLATGPVEVPRREARYGDIGFLVLGELLAAVAGRPLDALVAERVAGPLGLAAAYRRLSAIPGAADPGGLPVFASTGAVRPRAPAPGQEGLWVGGPSWTSRPGEVDDDNAWVMDGVAGHAGLFGTAGDVAAFGEAVLAERAGAGRLAPPRLWAQAHGRDAETSGSTRALGFDTLGPDDPRDGASAGRRVGRVPPGAVGHLGFTGTSLWVDLGVGLVVALCTNRTAGPSGRAEVRIRGFRPRFHDAVVETIQAERCG